MTRATPFLLLGLALVGCRTYDRDRSDEMNRHYMDDLDIDTRQDGRTWDDERAMRYGRDRSGATMDDTTSSYEAPTKTQPARAGEDRPIDDGRIDGGRIDDDRIGTMPAGAPRAWSDEQFVVKASQCGQFEVESSRIALEKASSGKIRDFARMMIEEHGTANGELDSIAMRINAHVPTGLDEKHQGKLDELRDLSGPAFDKKYLECQIKAHDKGIELFERASREAKNGELREFATKTLATLRKHREALDDVEVSPTKL